MAARATATEAELDQRVAAAAIAYLGASRVALLELELTAQRFRALAVQGPGSQDGSFVSRTVVGWNTPSWVTR